MKNLATSIILAIGIYVAIKCLIGALRANYREHEIREAHRKEMRADWLREQAEKTNPNRSTH